MIGIEKVDHIGIRIREKQRSIAFYEGLGFALITDTGFAQGHPVIMQHPSGVVLNLLGPSSEDANENILMDVSEKYTGITHVALKIGSLVETEAFFAAQSIEITGRFSFKDMNAIFIRDPDRNVIELDEYPCADPASRQAGSDDDYCAHP